MTLSSPCALQLLPCSNHINMSYASFNTYLPKFSSIKSLHHEIIVHKYFPHHGLLAYKVFIAHFYKHFGPFSVS